jgi:hypothetical protein
VEGKQVIAMPPPEPLAPPFDRRLSLDLDHLIVGLERPALRPAWRAWLRSLTCAAERRLPAGAVSVAVRQ